MVPGLNICIGRVCHLEFVGGGICYLTRVEFATLERFRLFVREIEGS